MIANVEPLKLFQSVLQLVLMMVPGFLLRKLKIADGNLAKGLAAIVLYVAQPAMLVVMFIRPYDSSVMLRAMWVFIFGMLSHAVTYAITMCLFKRTPEQQRKVYRFAAIFANTGYMGIPVVMAVLGEQAVIYVSIYIITFNLFSWSLGCLIYSGDKKYISAKKILVNPATVPIFIGLLFFLLPINQYVPTVVINSLTALEGLVSPLAMMIIGIRLAEVDFKTAFKDKYLPLSLGLRLLVFPALTWAIMRLVGLTGLFRDTSYIVMAVVLICASTPPSTATSMFAEKFGADTQTASKAVSVGTVLSILTMPLLALLLQV